MRNSINKCNKVEKMPWIKRLLFISALLTVQSVFAEWGEGWDPIDPPIPTTSQPGKIEVLEFFWYGCPHCYNLEPAMEEWLKTQKGNIEFHRVPSPLNPSWAVHAQFYYAAEALGRELGRSKNRSEKPSPTH